MADDWRSAPFRPAQFMSVDLDLREDADGTIRLRSNHPLEAIDANLARSFLKMAAAKGDAPALAERGPDGAWAYTSFAELAAQVQAAAQWLLDTLPRGSVLVVMAENSVAVAALGFAAFATGTILCPVSPAYGVAGGDHARLRHVFAKTRPAAIFADPNPKYAAALEAIGSTAIVISRDPAPFGDAVALADVLATTPTAAVADAIAAIDTDAPASYMMTSGSTGLPKVVEQSLSALASNTAQGIGLIGRAAGWDETMLDWLPWHHAAGASVLRAGLLLGGTLHIDAGKPAPGLFATSIANLRELSVPYFNNVPLGYAMLVDAMDADTQLRDTFFAKMRLMLYGGAGLPQHVYDRLQAHAVAATGHRVHMTTGYGMTETVSGCCAIHFETDKVGIGLPGPGVELKLVPNGARYEVRMRGPMLMRSYLDEPDKTASVFDEEGYYRTGDMAVFHDRAAPEQGLAFAGRMAEEFKLSNGTWVYGGQLREALLKALAPLVAELVVADDSRPFLTLLAWPKQGAPDDAFDQIVERLREFNATQRGASATVRRVALFDRPPAADANEISDKGTINRRAVLDNRSDLVDALYAEPPEAGVREI
ncbi:AMP-binding protein [Glacieibacterium frigidum]|uniref:AMP-binding protein n=1 Tax=Glacieibacterium frigidum TaxID=2593303 RepID=A0A552U775_9SPHN|nr:AMP-binding protein [Glacieibacterium frigidum]TRW14068.1 AMP-binding protein [Glacieibacterium frigidum]